MIFLKRKSNTVQPRQISTKHLELETAKEILQEVFHARSSDVEEMIHNRLMERNHHRKEEEGLWPAMFCLGE
jgi:hypothetical protein